MIMRHIYRYSCTCLISALVATGSLALAIATDYWLYMSEPVYTDYPIGDKITTIMVIANSHSGLWRACPFYPDVGELHIKTIHFSSNIH